MRLQMILLVGLVALFAWFVFRNNSPEWSYFRGQTMGTTYLIACPSQGLSQHAIDSLLRVLNQSLSTYDSHSDISQLNRSDSFFVRSKHLSRVLRLSQDMYQQTAGRFDPTVGSYTEAWGFSHTGSYHSVKNKMGKPKQAMGFDKVNMLGDLVTKPKHLQLDLNAIAKGYAVDVLAMHVEGQQVFDYMVEIGGELRCGGRNAKRKRWRIGIRRPSTARANEPLLKVWMDRKGTAMATSGNYLNYQEMNGIRYGHIFSPQTGRPVQTDLLSVSILSRTCAEADAVATACMTMTLKTAQQWLKTQPHLGAILLYQNAQGDTISWVRTWQDIQIEAL